MISFSKWSIARAQMGVNGNNGSSMHQSMSKGDQAWTVASADVLALQPPVSANVQTNLVTAGRL